MSVSFSPMKSYVPVGDTGSAEPALPKPQGAAAPGPAVTLRAVDATQRQGLVLDSPWGKDIAVSDGQHVPKLIEISFKTPAGAFEVWLEYAAAESRPVTILIDGLPVASNAAAQTTPGWMPEHQAWHRQTSVNLSAGDHAIALARNQEAFAFPHVRRLALLPIVAAEPSELAQADFERRIVERASVLTPAEMESVVRNVTPALRPLFTARRSPQAVMALLGEICGALTADVAVPQERTGFSGPFNGQLQRQAIFNRLDAAFGFDALVETGAYLGTTTEMLAGLGRPVFSCELSRRFYLRTATRLAGHANVKLVNTDSRSFLRDLFAGEPGWRMPFFYLDAHWNDDLPLPEELLLIGRHQRDFVVFVDDFQHPDPGYGYDKYAGGVELTLDYLLPRLDPALNLVFLVPAAAAQAETGARRGTLIVVPRALYDEYLSGECLLLRVYPK